MKSHQGRSRITERTSSIGNLFFIHPPRNRYRNIFGCISFGNEPNWQLESKSSKSLYKDVSYKMYRNVLQKKKKKAQNKTNTDNTTEGEQRHCETTANRSCPGSRGREWHLDNTL